MKLVTQSHVGERKQCQLGVKPAARKSPGNPVFGVLLQDNRRSKDGNPEARYDQAGDTGDLHPIFFVDFGIGHLGRAQRGI